MRMLRINQLHWQVFGSSLFLMLASNFTFLQKLREVYSGAQWFFMVSVCMLFSAALAFFLNLVCHGRSAKWVLSAVMLLSAVFAYFMDTYGTVIDVAMLNNASQTNWAETADLLNASMLLRLILFGVLPSIILFRMSGPKGKVNLAEHLRSWFVSSVLLLALMVGLLAASSSQYATFFREHKLIRYYSNPLYPIVSVVGFVKQFFDGQKGGALQPIAQDARIVEPPSERKELIVLVVGETARADHFSLNGYSRITNPALSKENVLSFKDVSSCGTSTAISVPCMFSQLGMADFSVSKAKRTMNALDVLVKEGVEVLWRDNNSDSKNVANRLRYEDYKTPSTNTICDEECRDEGMLVGLDDYINARKGKDVLIVLHQMGNHGPAYYKRYPKQFEKFKPVCKTNELSNCSKEEIINAYDNAILYTDDFLAKVIRLLKKHDNDFSTAMLYVSDHGESLGEYGLYLHGAPRSFAPKEQTHVPAVFWAGQYFQYSVKDLKKYENEALSHDDLFCALMFGFEVRTELCRPKTQQ
jgi:lipid A ethanolaminephosphotransferase